jgi:uncharacterized protein YejL (UPF0352 family)
MGYSELFAECVKHKAPRKLSDVVTVMFQSNVAVTSKELR